MSPVSPVRAVDEPETAAAVTTPAGPSSSRRGALRRHRAMIVVVLGFVAAVVVAIVTGGTAATSDPLDPDNPGPDGTRAVARVLDAEGVDVTVARGVEELEAAEVDDSATVVVTSTELVSPGVADRVLEAAGGADLVLVQPRAFALEAFELALESVVAPSDGEVAADCASPRFDGLTLEVDRASAYAGAGAETGCFPDGDGRLLVSVDGVTVLGAGEALTNDQVLRADNAALALRLLGSSDRLVWYVPQLGDAADSEAVGAGALLPDWVQPGIWLGAIVLIGVVLWRARRLGPLVTEPLPVVVKAIETTRSRGRLYRRAGDRGHAAAGLRAATRGRLAVRLRLGAGVTPATLVHEVARHLGQAPSEVAVLVADDAPAPATDRDLIRLATDLAALEEEVRRS